MHQVNVHAEVLRDQVLRVTVGQRQTGEAL